MSLRYFCIILQCIRYTDDLIAFIKKSNHSCYTTFCEKIIILIICIVGIIGFFWYKKSSAKVTKIENTTVQTKDLDETISASGKHTQNGVLISNFKLPDYSHT